jgi:hypothetical protein
VRIRGFCLVAKDGAAAYVRARARALVIIHRLPGPWSGDRRTVFFILSDGRFIRLGRFSRGWNRAFCPLSWSPSGGMARDMSKWVHSVCASSTFVRIKKVRRYIRDVDMVRFYPYTNIPTLYPSDVEPAPSSP